MTILISSATSAAAKVTLSMTLGNDGGLLTGYSTIDVGYGSLSPDVLKGETITNIYTIGGGFLELNFTIDANVPQAFFSVLDLSDGGIGTFNSGDATYSSGGGETRWFWTAAPLAGSGTIDVIIY